MEAKKLNKSKGTISKGKIKKTLKNVICRPDIVFWPDVSESEVNDIEKILKKYCVPISNFIKPHWKEIKSLKKIDRPKPPPIKKVDNLYFGISECYDAIQNKTVSVVIVESLVNPQSIAQPIVDACVKFTIPVVCVKNLRILCKNNFGIQTSCLGVKTGGLLDLSSKVKEISQNYKPVKISPKIEAKDEVCLENNEPIQVEVGVNDNPYLYRPNKSVRIFVPSNTDKTEDKNKFNGQQFIKISEKHDDKPDISHNTYMRMILKKIRNNPNRVKVKEKL